MAQVSHVEWLVSDLDRALAFYQGLFGWRFEVWSTHYRLYTPPNGCCVGLMESTRPRRGDSPLVHVQVEDLGAALARAIALGGRVRTEITPIPGYGSYAHVLDPDGNQVGLFSALPDSKSAR